MTYTATITSASLRLRESRIIAGILLQNPSAADWKQALLCQNILQMNSEESIRRIARLLRNRLEPLGEGLWKVAATAGDSPVAENERSPGSLSQVAPDT